MIPPGSPGAERALYVTSPTDQSNTTAAFPAAGSNSGAAPAGSLEVLEPRQMLSSVVMESGAMVIYGNKTSANQLGVYASGSNLIAVHNGETRTVKASSVSKIIIHGSSKGDNLWITKEVTKASVIKGYAGNDTLWGGGGSDWVYGGDGNDLAWGNGANDFVYGEAGDDQIWGGAGTDKLDGGPGNDKTDGSGSTPSTPASGGGVDSSASAPKPVITAVTSKTLPAGTGFHVNAVNSSLGTGTPLATRYQWDFDDEGSSFNKMEGFNAAHLYTKSGNYTVKLTITNAAGKTNTTSMDITVTAANRKVIYVSSSGSDSNSGSSSSPIKSFDKAMSLVRDNTEILFRRGDTFSANNGMIKSSNVVIGAYGSGNRPVLKFTGERNYGVIFRTDESGENVTIRDLQFDSIYGSASDEDGLPSAIRPDAANTTIVNNAFYNVGYAVNGNQKPKGLLVQGNTAPSMTGLKGYFAWVQGADHVYVGNYVANAYAHVLRVVGADRVNISYNDFANPSEDKTVRTTLVIHKGSYAYVSHNKLSDGNVAIGPLGESQGLSDKGGRWTWGVFEDNTINSGFDIVHGAERIMIRNNIINRDSNYALKIDGYNSQYGRGVKDLTIVNNTVFNDSSRGNFIKFEGEAPGTTLANNLYVAPSLVTGSWNTAPVLVYESSLAGFDFIGNNVWAAASPTEYAQGGMNYVWPTWSNSEGYKTPSEWNAYGVVGTDYFSDVSISGTKPSTSSVAANAGKWFAGVFTDINGKTRPSSGSWTAGAVEV
jgi:PKD repeat protein